MSSRRKSVLNANEAANFMIDDVGEKILVQNVAYVPSTEGAQNINLILERKMRDCHNDTEIIEESNKKSVIRTFIQSTSIATMKVLPEYSDIRLSSSSSSSSSSFHLNSNQAFADSHNSTDEKWGKAMSFADVALDNKLFENDFNFSPLLRKSFERMDQEVNKIVSSADKQGLMCEHVSCRSIFAYDHIPFLHIVETAMGKVNSEGSSNGNLKMLNDNKNNIKKNSVAKTNFKFEKESPEFYSLLVIFFYVLRQYIPLKYISTYSFLEQYPEFIDRDPIEIGKLKICANWFDLVLFTVKPQNNKSFLLQVVPCISEGHQSRYITGSGESKKTSDRVNIFRTEGNVAKVSRGWRHRVSKKKKNATKASSWTTETANTSLLYDNKMDAVYQTNLLSNNGLQMSPSNLLVTGHVENLLLSIDSIPDNTNNSSSDIVYNNPSSGIVPIFTDSSPVWDNNSPWETSILSDVSQNYKSYEPSTPFGFPGFSQETPKETTGIFRLSNQRIQNSDYVSNINRLKTNPTKIAKKFTGVKAKEIITTMNFFPGKNIQTKTDFRRPTSKRKEIGSGDNFDDFGVNNNDHDHDYDHDEDTVFDAAYSKKQLPSYNSESTSSPLDILSAVVSSLR